MNDRTWLEIESHVQAMKATVDCVHDDKTSRRVACVDCAAGRMHNLSLDFARRTVRRYWSIATERGRSEHPDDLEKYIDRAISEALEDDT